MEVRTQNNTYFRVHLSGQDLSVEMCHYKIGLTTWRCSMSRSDLIPPSAPLKEPVRTFEETTGAFEVLRETFFPEAPGTADSRE